jgi:hypothetical protein
VISHCGFDLLISLMTSDIKHFLINLLISLSLIILCSFIRKVQMISTIHLWIIVMLISFLNLEKEEISHIHLMGYFEMNTLAHFLES